MDLQKGQRFVVLRNVEAKCLASVGGLVLSELGDVTVRSGEVLVVLYVAPFDSATVIFRPHRYAALEQEFVDRETRDRAGYTGYALAVEKNAIGQQCQLLSL